MGYKEDLRKINAVLRDPNSRCYDPLLGRLPFNIQPRKEANQRELDGIRAVMRRRRQDRIRAVLRWRRRNRIRYRAYMRRYMAQKRATVQLESQHDPIKSEFGGEHNGFPSLQ